MNNLINPNVVSDVSGNTENKKIKVIDNMTIVYNPDGSINKELSRKFPRKDLCYRHKKLLER